MGSEMCIRDRKITRYCFPIVIFTITYQYIYSINSQEQIASKRSNVEYVCFLKIHVVNDDNDVKLPNSYKHQV